MKWPKLIGALSLAAIAVAAGCKVKPTYKNEFVAGDLKKMVLHDYNMDVETRREGDSLQAFFWKVGLLKPGQMELHSEAAEALQRVLLCATRISLSTDADLKFLEVKMADALTGASVTLWRFVPDIRDSMYTRLPDEEYINRLVVEFNTEMEVSPREWKDAEWSEPMTMQSFLAKQVVLRAKRQSLVGLQAHEDVSEPSRLVVVLDNWAAIEEEGAQQEKNVAELVEKTAKSVVEGYRYTGFRELVLKDHRGMALRKLAL